MTLKEFKEMLEETKLPVTYYEFEEKAPPLPFLVYFETETDNFAADGIVYHEVKRIAVELYIKKRDFTLEQSIETLFYQNGIFWQKSFQYLDDEKCYFILYEMEI